MNKKSLLGLIFLLGFYNSSTSQNFNFDYVDSNVIKYDYAQYLIDMDNYHIPDSEYLSLVSNLTSISIISRCDRSNKYVFPLRVSVGNTIQVISVTSAGLYALGYNGRLSISEFESLLYESLLSKVAMVIDTLPKPCVGSANYLKLFRTDPEVILYGQNKWLFMNYFFRKSENGTRYDYIGLDEQLVAVVLRLFSWGILVSDGCGSDEGSIYIDIKDYPQNLNIPTRQDIIWVQKWMDEFRNKHIYGNRLINRTEWEQWRTDWWVL